MGLLLHPATADERTLSTRTLVGRSAACALRIDDPSVSGEHATLWFRDGRWWVRDLGSRNGTRVDGEPLAPGEERRLAPGSTIAWGASNSPWILADAGPPRPRARELATGTVTQARGGVLLLPPGDNPELSVVRQADGTWIAEGDLDSRPVNDGDTVVVDDRAWRLMLPIALEPTQLDQLQVAVHFRVSADEETVEIDLVVGGTLASLPTRSANYLLLLLARQRLTDATEPEAEQGWVQRALLARQLRVSPRTINVQLHRLRQAIGEVDDALAARLLECRGSRTGQIRIGTADLSEQPL